MPLNYEAWPDHFRRTRPASSVIASRIEISFGKIVREILVSLNTLGRLFVEFLYSTKLFRGTRYRTWSRYYATSRKVADSRPDEVTGFFQLT
jgi:hypothetical protein